MPFLAAAAFAWAIAAGAPDAAAQTTISPRPRAAAPLSDTARAVHLLSRATYGVRPQDIEAVLAMGIDAWLDRQLHPERIDDSALERRLMRYPAAAMTPAELFDAFPRPNIARARILGITDRAALDGAVDRTRLSPEQRQQLAAMNPQRILPELVAAKLERAAYSERQLEEVMTDFWFNHFNVSFDKGDVRYLVADFERNAIRRHVFGRFEDMLVATAQHPAMLVYLDNVSSSAPPDSGRLAMRQRLAAAAGVDRPVARRGGLNENYARELLELHTLGVDGGYTQEDVVNVARALTGWTVMLPNRRLLLADGFATEQANLFAFQFNPVVHDFGAKTVLGHELPPNRGIDDGLDVLRMLARHPATAGHIATKLVTHFVADDPPPELVAEIARMFRETDGDLREVTRALFTAESFYDPAVYRAKVKRPFEFVASSLRVTNADLARPQALVEQLRMFRHVPYAESAPTGYPTTHEDWVSAGAMLNRMNLAITLSSGAIPGVRPRYIDIVGEPLAGLATTRVARNLAGAAGQNGEHTRTVTRAVLEHVLPGQPVDELEAAILEDLAENGVTLPRDVIPRVLGLALGSPAFQRY